MKKITLFSLAIISLFSANAQLRVFQSGHVRIGNSPTSSGTGIGLGTPTVNPDTTSTLCIMGSAKNFSNGYIYFGGGKKVGIGEKSETPNPFPKSDILRMVGIGGIEFSTYGGTTVSYYPAASSSDTPTKFTFNCGLNAEAYYTLSDIRLKTEIKPIAEDSKSLELITPISYKLNSYGLQETAQKETAEKADIDTEIVTAKPDPRTRFGFVAQEVREIYPDLVYEDPDGLLAVDYDGFIPLLVSEIKSLRAELTAQSEIIEKFTSEATQPRKVAAGVESVSDTDAALYQNKPNPFKATTEIRHNVPETAKDAMLCVYDLNGHQILRMTITDRGESATTIEAGKLTPGLYIYSLIIDGTEIDSKRMIVTD